MSTTSKYVLGVLIVIAVVLGYKIYEKKSNISSAVSNTPPASENKPQTNKPAVSSTNNSRIPGPDLVVLRSAIDQNATSAQKEKFFSTVNKYAVTTSTIDITSCLPEPIVAAVKMGSEISFVNKGNKSETIQFDASHTYTVNPGAVVKVMADLGHGLGSYGYSCPDKSGVAGIVTIR